MLLKLLYGCALCVSALFIGCAPEVRVASAENFRAQINALADSKRSQYEQNPARIVEEMRPSAQQNVSPNPAPLPPLAEPNLPASTPITSTSFAGTHKHSQAFATLADEVARNHEELSTTQEGARKIQEVLHTYVSEQWGETDAQTATQTLFVKYTNHYKNRATIDFEKGVVQVETLESDNPKEALQRAIVATLLAPFNPDGIEITNDSEIHIGARPYLADYIKDNEGKEILYEWRANRYAQYLIANNLQKSKHGDKELWSVRFEMQKDYPEIQNAQYGDIVNRYAKQYNLDPALILGIIKTESSFNPYATSKAPAYGLMQVVPSTAGADAHEQIHNRKGKPTANMLYVPETNIQYGTTYLNILSTRYLKGVRDPQSLEYCMIAAYNAGAGAVLQTFSANRTQAIAQINAQTSQEIYTIIHTKLVSLEGRRYLQKVTTAKKSFAK
ncbi:MAG: murein transglycosylase domain-containing protein [Helicobacter sp.]|nr:murein transglycosylase domain-containing protein [Helicobacter sp.]